ncbi:hypothetical protein CONPUDRAFT_16973, partial [Coniophora puteana RWD-64-598 SS2]
LPLTLRHVAYEFEGINSEYGLESVFQWQSLVPDRTAGFVHLGEDNFPFAVSMYHSLHCLDTVRRAILEADTYTCTNGSRDKLDMAMKHSKHCFDYIAQLLLCTADSTLEPIVDDGLEQNPSAVPAWALAGVGVTHRCCDWNQVRRFVE